MSAGVRPQVSPRRRALLATVPVLALCFWPDAASAQQPKLRPADWKAMQAVITAQRAAFLAGDGDKAFRYATPAIRAQFGDPATFLEIVRSGYAPLLTARYVEFLQGAVIDGAIVMPLRLIDPDNTVRVALYIMEKQPGGSWRIAGCRIAPSTTLAT
jgi:uncharacterized protein DUF4864